MPQITKINHDNSENIEALFERLKTKYPAISLFLRTTNDSENVINTSISQKIELMKDYVRLNNFSR